MYIVQLGASWLFENVHLPNLLWVRGRALVIFLKSQLFSHFLQ